jgi:hypothetical protein
MKSKEEVVQLIDENVDQIHILIQEKIEIWSNDVLYSPLWWFGVCLSVIPWIIWIILRKNDSTDRLLYAGFFVMTISIVLDVLGDQLGLWHYRYNVIPVLPTYFPWDITLMPVTIMLLIQYKPNINPWVKAIFFSIVTSFVAEPIIEWMEIYQPLTWKYIYSVPIQLIIYLTAHYITRRDQFSKLY